MATSKITNLILAAVKIGIIKTNAGFYKNFYSTNEADFYNNVLSSDLQNRLDDVVEQLGNEDTTNTDVKINAISVYDEEFPSITQGVKNNGDKPFLLFYSGDISLLKDFSNNIAVIGLIAPDINIVEREKKLVKQLVEHKINIVSGLAKGCDSVAHQTCIECGGKTVAILPTTIGSIFPAENKGLAKKIVEAGGLLITEYHSEPQSKYDAIKRFTDRDRLQAMFSKAVILTASYRHGEGDAGSRFAMDAAKKYGLERFVMFNDRTDTDNAKFGMSIDYINKENVEIVTQQNIESIINSKSKQLETSKLERQMSFS